MGVAAPQGARGRGGGGEETRHAVGRGRETRRVGGGEGGPGMWGEGRGTSHIGGGAGEPVM